MNQEAKISELTELPGALSPDALLAIVQGGVTYHATGQQVIDMVAANLSRAQLNAILKTTVPARVNAAGTTATVMNGRIGLSVTRSTTGRYVITNTEGLTFFSAAAAPIGGSNVRLPILAGLNSNTLTVDWRDGSGALVNTDFALLIELELAP